MKIEKVEHFIMAYRTGTISNYTKSQIQKILGFPPNLDDDHDKVTHSWMFKVNGFEAAIWDYKGSHYFKIWSIYDPHNVLGNLFVIDDLRTVQS